MRDAALIHFCLPLEESDLHYLHARTNRNDSQQPHHDELAVLYCLLGVGNIRLRQHEGAERRLLFAKSLERSFADPPLLLASLAAHASGEGRQYLVDASMARPDCLERKRVDELLWLLGVPRHRREVVASKGPITQNLELLVWAIECQEEQERSIARRLLTAARKRLGLPAGAE